MNTYIKERRDEGFTLIELLIAIVVVGILTAVVIVGIGGLADNGKKGACQASKDAVKAAIAVHYNNNPGATPYPTSFDELTAAPRHELDVADGTTATGTTMTGSGWSVTMSGGGATPPTLSACPA